MGLQFVDHEACEAVVKVRANCDLRKGPPSQRKEDKVQICYNQRIATLATCISTSSLCPDLRRRNSYSWYQQDTVIQMSTEFVKLMRPLEND